MYTSKDWSLSLFIQDSLHCKQGGLYKTSFLPPHRLFPTCYHRNKNIIPTLYTCCSPPVTIETRTSFLSCSHLLTIETRTSFLSSIQAVPHLLLGNKGKAGKILAMHWLLPRIQGLVGYTVHLQLGSHAWDLYVVYYNHAIFLFFSMEVKGIQDSIANEKHPSYKIINNQDDKEANIEVKVWI